MRCASAGASENTRKKLTLYPKFKESVYFYLKGWSRSKPGTQNLIWVSFVYYKDRSLGPSPAAFQGALWQEAGTRHSRMGCQCSQTWHQIPFPCTFLGHLKLTCRKSLWHKPQGAAWASMKSLRKQND